MLINYDQKNTCNVRFISYSGKWPTLCSGILDLEIEGTVYRFGYGEKHEKFWRFHSKKLQHFNRRMAD